MADIDVYSGLTLISSPAAGDRVPLGTGPGAGGYSLRGSFSWRTAGNYLISSGTTFAATGPTAGTVDGAHSQWLTNGFNAAYGLSIGVAGTGNSWLQCQRNDGTGTLYSLLLNPLGGNVGIGTAAPATRLHLKSNIELFRLETATVRGSGNGFATFNDPTGRKGFYGYGGSADDFYVFNDMNRELIFGTNGISRWQITRAGSYEPNSDNSYAIGHPSFRISGGYSASSWVVTSDERAKTWRGGMSPGELSAAKRVAAELGFYQWNDAISEKGADGARYHFGVRAQQVWAIMADEGLIDPLAEGVTPDSKYAFLCWDEWEEIAPVEAIEDVLDEEGNVIVAAQPSQQGRDAGDRFGIRSDQLALFLIAAQEARLAALEAAL